MLLGLLPNEDSLLARILWFTMLVHAILWTEADAREHGLPIGSCFRWFLRLAFAFAMPVYCFRSRGWKGIGLLLTAIGFLALNVFIIQLIEELKVWR